MQNLFDALAVKDQQAVLTRVKESPVIWETILAELKEHKPYLAGALQLNSSMLIWYATKGNMSFDYTKFMNLFSKK